MLTMPSPSLLMPASRILSRALSKAPAKSPSGGPSRMRRSSDMASAARLCRRRTGRLRALLLEEELIMLLFEAIIAALIWCTIGASLLARPRWGEDRVVFVLTWRRTGDMDRLWCSWRCCCWRCCAMMDGVPLPPKEPAAPAAAFAPRLWADCSFRNARCVPGDGGAWSVVDGGGSEGTGRDDSLIGLGILDSPNHAPGRTNGWLEFRTRNTVLGLTVTQHSSNTLLVC